MKQLVLVRHGQSEWNLANRFTGWVDVDLSPQGFEEARTAGQMLCHAGFTFDVAYTSVLKRAIRTLWLILDELDALHVPVHKHIALNERHYGALQGLDKRETAAQHGDKQVHLWRRGYAVQPPPLQENDSRHPRHDPRYAGIQPLPASESLADTVARVIPCWQQYIKPQLIAGQRVLIAAHGNSLRALIKHLEHISDADIMELNIPTGAPLVYDLGDDLEVQQRHYLKDGLNDGRNKQLQ